MNIYRRIIISLLILIIFFCSYYLLRTIFAIRQSAIILSKINAMDLKNDKDIDLLINEIKPIHYRFIYPSLKSNSYNERMKAAYILVRKGLKQYISYIQGGLKNDDLFEQNLAIQLLWSLWFNESGIEAREILYECKELNQIEKFDEAIKKQTRLTVKNPDFAEAYNQRAITYYLKGEFDRSIADCRRALELNPIHFGAQNGMGECYIKLKKYLEAKKSFEDTLKITPYSKSTRNLLEMVEEILKNQNQQFVCCFGSILYCS